MEIYNFVPILSKSPFSNAVVVLGAMIAWYYFNNPPHMAFHDLTKGGKVPPMVKTLLGLSLKFCVPSKYTNFDLKTSLD